jgi:hypothetical protein
VRRESNQQHGQALRILCIIPLIDSALPFSSYVPLLPTRTLDGRGRCTERSSWGGSICRPRPPALNSTTRSIRNIPLIPKLHSDARSNPFSSRAKDLCRAQILSSSRASAGRTCARNSASGQAFQPQNVEFQELSIALLRICGKGALLEIFPRLCPSEAIFFKN